MHSEKRNPCRLRWSPDPKDSAANQRKRLAALAATKRSEAAMVKSVEGGLRRLVATLLVFSFLALKVLPQLATTAICAADALSAVGLYAVFSPFPPGEKLRRSWDDYTFHRSLLDVALVSAARGLLIFLAYVFCTIVKPRVVLYYRKRQQLERRRKQRDRGYLSLSRGAVDHLSGDSHLLPLLQKSSLGLGSASTNSTKSLPSLTNLVRKGSAEFLLFTYLICLASVGFLVFKASCYDYAQDQRVYSHFQGFGAVLMLINVGFAALHVFCAKTFDLLQGRRRRLQLVTSPGARSGAAAAEPEWGGGRWEGVSGKHHAMLESLLAGSRGSAAAAGVEDEDAEAEFNGGDWGRGAGAGMVAAAAGMGGYPPSIPNGSLGIPPSLPSEEGFNYTSNDESYGEPGGHGYPHLGQPRAHGHQRNQSYGSLGSHGSLEDLVGSDGSTCGSASVDRSGSGAGCGPAMGGENSRWVSIGAQGGLSVHYQVHLPSSSYSSQSLYGAAPTLEDLKPSEEAVLLMHGFYGNVSVWADVAAEVARRSGRRVVCFDRIGFGLSSRPLAGETVDRQEPEQEAAVADTTQEQDQAEARDPAAPYGSEGGAKVALALCRRLRIGAVHVVAHDDAALAAMRLALLSDQQDQQQQQHDSQVSGAQQGPGVRVLSLCLLHPNTHGEVASKLMEHLLTSGIKAAARRHLVRMEVEVALRRQCYRSGTIPADRMHFYKRPLYLRHWERALRLGIQANQRDQDAGEGLAREIVVSGGEAAGGRRRVMVVTGRHDAMVRPEDCGPLYDPVPLRVLEDCGHLSHEECPADLATMVADFVLAGGGR